MSLLDLFFPKRCVLCRRLGRYFCVACTKTIEFSQQICPVCERPAIDGKTHPKCQTRYTLTGLTSFFRYNGVIRQAIKIVKYRFVSDLAQECIDLIPDSFLQCITRYIQPASPAGWSTTLIPIPLHPERERFRGFNQTEVLGKILAERIGVPMRTDVLQRVRKTIPQVEVNERKKRLANMDGVFAVNQLTLRQSSGQAIFLFDDVFTTGATLRAGANVLKRAGVKRVWGIALAHG